MKRTVFILLTFLFPLTLSAQEIRDMDIRVEVEQKGNATVTTDWDVTVTSGTEWYIPVENLGSMTVTSFKVSEDGKTFVDEGFDWKSKRSLEQKKGRSGIARTYYYQILDGTRHPGRDKVIILCLAAELSLDQTQKGLILAGHNPLYARSKRDAVLIYAIRKKMTLVAANDLLDQFDEQMLA